MTAYAYSVEGNSIICPQCNDNPLYNLATTEEEAIGYPDGYTCTDCSTTIKGETNEQYNYN
jgi:hypothetical protein